MVASILNKMIQYSDKSLHDINHFLKVHSYASCIAELEGIDKETKEIVEIAAIVHDIACPSLRERYGKAEGKMQEKEGPSLAEKLLEEFNLSEKVLNRVLYLVGHHHTYKGVDGIDYQILLEADYLVNADESNYSKENILNMYNSVFKTKAGKELLKNIYLD